MNSPIRILLLFFTSIIVLIGCVLKQTKIKNSPPNILFAIADDASWKHFSAYGCKWVKTPSFDMIAQQGILFTHAYTPNAKCAPSRSSILTGLNSWQLKAAANHVPFFPTEFSSYVEILKKNGFHVGYTGKGWAPGIANDTNGVARELTGRLFNKHELVPPTKYIHAVDYAANFKDFMEQKPDDEPFCFWYGGFEPHRYYEYGTGVSVGKKEISDIDEVPDFWPDVDSVRNDMLDYAFEIEYFDKHLQKMIAYLDEMGELENTIILVTADNGMPFPRVKGQSYEYSNHLPLAIMWPDGIKNPGRIVDDYVNFIDFAPTFLELARVNPEASGMHKMAGRSLTDIFYSEKEGQVNSERNFILIGKERHDLGRPDDLGYPMRGIVKDSFLYIRNYYPDRWPAGNPETGYLNCDGGATKTFILNQRRIHGVWDFWNLNFGKRVGEELYNIIADPYCMINLVNEEKYSAVVESLKEEMTNKLIAENDPRVLGNGDIFKSYPYAFESTINMYNRYIKQGEKIPTGWVHPSDYEPEWLEH